MHSLCEQLEMLSDGVGAGKRKEKKTHKVFVKERPLHCSVITVPLHDCVNVLYLSKQVDVHGHLPQSDFSPVAYLNQNISKYLLMETNRA